MFTCLGKKSKDGCDRSSENWTIHSVQDEESRRFPIRLYSVFTFYSWEYSLHILLAFFQYR